MPAPHELYGRPWIEREYVLALDGYINFKDDARNPTSQWVQDLAQLMGRTPAAICMRMENFASIDPEVSQARRGLGNLSALCKLVFAEWSIKPDHLRSCAQAFRRDADHAWSSRTLFDPYPVAVPKAFGKYELLDQIGRGTFGSVYSCINTETNEVAALKIIHADRVNNDETLHRFLQEIRALKSLNHPNVIALREDNLEFERSFPGFVMDLAEINLAEYSGSAVNLRGGRPGIEQSEAIGIMRSITRATAGLHGHVPKIIHRDINPNNILRLPNGMWVLADFGLAKFVGTAQFTTTFATRTEPGWGTTYFAAPEQYRDFKRTDERSDTYALGVLLWELFTSSWPTPERERDGLPADLSPVFLKATERDPELRFKNAPEFLKAIEATELFRGYP